jgi:segregation and condensation protein B
VFGDLNEEQLESAIEALLFVSDEPVSVLTLSEMIEAEVSDIERALECIAESLEQRSSGIRLKEVSGGWRLYTAPEYHEMLERYVLSWDTRRLSQAALETLAIIAYGQPITRLGISSIRGVNSDSSVNSLVEKGLVRESGQADAPGYPMTYSTTRKFLERFGLRDTGDLPPIEDFAPDEKTAMLLREGLSAHAHFGLVEDEEQPTGLEGLDAVEVEAGTDLAAAANDAITQLIAQSAGVVEKIDFSELEFEE